MGARLTYHLPYFFSDMSLVEEDARITYKSHRHWPAPTPATVEARVELGPSLGTAAHGTLEDFLCERYFLYSEKGGLLFRGQVHHTPYPLRSATLEHLDENLIERAGIGVSGPPVSVLASPGVDVDVYAIGKV